jgi:hypothetical protein
LREGSSERAAVLAALRVPLEKDLGQPVDFDVRYVNANDRFANVIALPVQPDGQPIDYLKIEKYHDWATSGAFEEEVIALLEFRDGRWRVLEWVIGPTDVSWEPWNAKYGLPTGLWAAPE